MLDFLRIYWLLFGGTWMMLSLLAWRLGRSPGNGWLRPGASITLILALALLSRVLTVWSTQPRLSDDLWRYIHDGRTLGVKLNNPYRYTPLQVGVEKPINHPYLATIYQPTSQWVFAVLARAAALRDGSSNSSPQKGLTSGSAHHFFRMGFVLFDLWIIALLMLKLLREHRSVWWASLYAWHPLPISEVAASGHQDVVGIAWLLMTLMLLDKRGLFTRDRRPALRALLAGGMLGLTVGVKPIVLPLALPMALTLRQPGKLALGTVGFAATLTGLYLPFALMEGGLDGMRATAHTFIGHWAFNSSLHGSLVALCGSNLVASTVMGVLLAVVLMVCLARRLDIWSTTLAYMLAGLLLSSTVHPWYLLWALALVPIRFNTAVWVLGLTVSWSYVALVDRESFRVPFWVLLAEYVPVYVLLGAQFLRCTIFRGQKTEVRDQRAHSDL